MAKPKEEGVTDEVVLGDVGRVVPGDESGGRRDGPPGPVAGFEHDEQLRAVRSRVETALGYVPNLYRNLAHAPRLLAGWIDFAWSLRFDAVSDRGVRELIIMRKALLHGADYEWRHHWGMALEAGIAESKLQALTGWSESKDFTPRERAVLQMTDELTFPGALAEKTWGQLNEHFDAQECVELILTAAFYSCVSQILAGLDVRVEESFAAVPPVPVGTAREPTVPSEHGGV